MKFELRDYQKECVDTILAQFKTLNSQIVQLPTGAGKTVILWHVIKAMQKKALIVAPTRELTEQLEETGRSVVKSCDIYLKKKSYWPHDKKNLIMTVQSATFAQKGERISNFNAELLIIDEAHRSRSKGLENLIQYHLDKGAKVLGLTATPERLDGKSLLDIYEELTFQVNLMELIHKGHLVDLECYKVKTRQKIDEIKYSMGDIAPNILRKLDVDARNEIILDIYLNRCPGKKTLVFCLNVEHAEKMADQFLNHGIKAAAIHGGMGKTWRKTILKLYRQGEIQVLCNCQLLTEGFDEPSIESLILSRPTKSKTLYCQMVGRGVRPYAQKEKCLLFDLSDEIHDVCNFNVLGGLPNGENFEFKEGEKLTEAFERKKLSIEEIGYDVEEFRLYKEDPFSKKKASESQKSIMWLYNVPFLDDITYLQAAYLLFKSKLLEKHGIDPRTYWEKWREEIPLHGEVKRNENIKRLIQRSRDSLHLG
jgi:superfamily II DNA or RNA helicase